MEEVEHFKYHGGKYEKGILNFVQIWQVFRGIYKTIIIPITVTY